MKNQFIKSLAAFALCVVAVVSCKKEIENQNGRTSFTEGSLVFKVASESVSGKTAISDGEVSWVKDDPVSIFWGIGGKTTGYASETGKTCSIIAEDAGEADVYYALTPANDDATVTDGVISYTLPAEQTGLFADANMAYATTTKEELTLYFKNLTGLIHFSIADEDVDKIVFEADEDIVGSVSASFDEEGDIVFGDVTNAGNTVTVSVGESREAYISVFAGVKLENGFMVVGYKGDTPAFTVSSIEPVTIARAECLDLGVLDTHIVTDYFVTPEGAGSKNGKSWTNAMGTEELRDCLAANSDAGISLIQALQLDGVTFHMAEGNYIIADPTPKRCNVEFNDAVPFDAHVTFLGGYPAGLTKKSTEGRDASAHKTAFTGNSQYGIFHFGNNFVPTFDGVTFCNASYDSGDGGAIDINYTTAYFTNCKFENNATTNSKSGGVFKVSNASVNCTDCQFSGNTSQNGSSLYIYNNGAVVNITRCSFTNETPSSVGIIDAVQCKTITIVDSEFSNSTASGHGAAINVSKGKVSISGTAFSGLKSSNGYGGAIYVDGTADVTLTACTFTKTSAKRGGAIYGNNGLLTATGCTFDGTNVTEQGGMAFIVNNFELTLKGCDIKDTYAAGNGGAINTNSNGAKLTITNNGEKKTVISGTYSSGGESGALHIYGGTVNVSNTVFDGCYISGTFKAGIGRFNGGNPAVCTFTGCEFKNCKNNSGDSGKTGGIVVENATVSFDNCLWEKNTAKRGSCIMTASASAKVTCNSCTFKNNTATQYGAAVAILSAANPQLDFTGCTFKDNHADSNAAIIFFDQPAVHVHFSGCEFLSNSSVNSGVIAYDYKRTNNNYLLTFDGCYFEGNTWKDKGMFNSAYESGYRKNVVFLNDCQFYNNHTTGTGWPWGHVNYVTGVCANNVTVYCEDTYPLHVAFAGTDVGCLVLNSTMVTKKAYANDHGAVFAAGGKAIVANNLEYYSGTTSVGYVYIQDGATTTSYGHSLYANGGGHLTPAATDKQITWDYLGTAGYNVAKRAFIWGGPDDSFAPAGKQDILDAINAFDITSKLPSEVSIGAEFLKWLNSLPSKPLDSRTFAWPGAYEPVK